MGSYTAGRRLRVGASDLNLGDAVDDAAVASWPDFIVAEYLRTGDLQQSGAAVSTSNEEQASALIAATPAGVSGPGLSDHFLGDTVRDTWTASPGNAGGTTPSAPLAVLHSTLGYRGPAGAYSGFDMHKPFTPSGDFTVEARMFFNSEEECRFFIWDNNASDDTVGNGDGIGVRYAFHQLQVIHKTNMDGESNPVGGALLGAYGGWWYLQIGRTGNNWKLQVSPDRQRWFTLISGYAHAFTVGKIGFHTFQAGQMVCDFIDVVR